MHCSIERLFRRVQSTSPSSERSTMPKLTALSHACMRVHWCHRASSKRRCHKMSLITTTTGSRCGLIEHHDADCAPPDDQAARFQQRSRRNLVNWSCAGHPRQQKRQKRPVVAAAGTEANPFQLRSNGRSRCAFEVRISCRNCLHVTVESEKMFEHGSRLSFQRRIRWSSRKWSVSLPFSSNRDC